MSAKRSGKFYCRNEKETLLSLGLKPAPLSGAGWIAKEDGENEVAMVQLKSTDAKSYRLDLLDMKKLEYHASVAHKLPIFLVQFLQENKIYAIVAVEDIADLDSALKTGKVQERTIFVDTNVEVESKPKIKKIKSSKKGRESFFAEREKRYGRK